MNKRMPQAAGEVSLLNVGDGDTKLSFDPRNPAERIRAARIVRDMLRRGYALLVEVAPGEFQRATDFREDVCEYVIADLDPVAAAEADALEEQHNGHQPEEARPGSEAPAAAADAPQRRGRKPGVRNIPADGTRAVAVAPSAGG
jgi:hypothetical protein